MIVPSRHKVPTRLGEWKEHFRRLLAAFPAVKVPAAVQDWLDDPLRSKPDLTSLLKALAWCSKNRALYWHLNAKGTNPCGEIPMSHAYHECLLDGQLLDVPELAELLYETLA